MSNKCRNCNKEIQEDYEYCWLCNEEIELKQMLDKGEITTIKRGVPHCEICRRISKELFLNKFERVVCKECADVEYKSTDKGAIIDNVQKLKNLGRKYKGEFIEPKLNLENN